MKQEPYRYNLKCEKCKKPFKHFKASEMFCGPICQEEYHKEKYKWKIKKKNKSIPIYFQM